MIFFVEGYHQFECGREDVFESVIGQMMQGVQILMDYSNCWMENTV